MEYFATFLRKITEYVLTPFDWLGPFWGLTILSILSGIAMLWVVGKTTPQARVEHSRHKMDSAVYEIRLFLDSPIRIILSLGRLVSNSLLYIAYMMPAFIILALPMAFMYLGLEARHGFSALPVNQPFVVTVGLQDGVDGTLLQVTPEEGIQITSPIMVVQGENKAYFRAVARKASSANIVVSMKNQQQPYNKLIVSDPTALQMAPQRVRGTELFYSYGSEEPIPAGVITSIGVEHESKDTRYLGISMPWWIWWLLLMMIAAFGLKKPMGVTL